MTPNRGLLKQVGLFSQRDIRGALHVRSRPIGHHQYTQDITDPTTTDHTTSTGTYAAVGSGRGADTGNPHRDGTTAPDTSIQVNPNRRSSASPVTSGRVSPPVIHTATTRSANTIPNIIPNTGSSTRRHNFIVGEQVYITNRITHLITPGPLDRAAIVTWVRPCRIDFRTLSGQETWRSLGNLRHLTEQEISSLNHLLNSDS